MKYFLYTLFGLAGASTAALAQTVYPAGVNGCVARWTFSNVTSATTQLPDSSGNGNNASAVLLTPSPNFRNIPNRAAAFDGDSAHYALVPHSSTLNLTELTMISVVSVKTFNSGPCQGSQILSKGYPHDVAGNYGLSFTDNVYDNGNCNAFDPSKQQLVAQWGFNGGVASPLMPGNYVNASDWYFLAASYSATGQIRYYQVAMTPTQQFTNIQPVYSTTTSSPVGTSTQPISIGRHLNPAYPYQFTGSMDEVILFNRALTNAEIQTVYNYVWAAPTSVTDISQADAFQLHHKDGWISVRGLGSQPHSIRVMDISGRVLYTQRDGRSSVADAIDLSAYRMQVLFVQVQSARGVETVKFLNN